MAVHVLKTHPAPFQAILEGLKTFEFRKDDRAFEVQDLLYLCEYSPVSGDYTSSKPLICRVTYILHGPGFGIPEGYCIMSIRLD